MTADATPSAPAEPPTPAVATASGRPEEIFLDAVADYVERALMPLAKRIIEIESKAAGAPDLRAKVDEHERRVVRHGEHLTRVETRITQIIARIERLENGRRE